MAHLMTTKIKQYQNILYPYKKSEILIEYNLPEQSSDVTLILGHGKYSDMYFPLYEYLAKQLPKENVNFVRYNYPFIDNPKNKPNKNKVKESYKAIMDDVKHELPNTKYLYVGGKSFGALMSSRYKNKDACGFVFLTYPLHSSFLKLPIKKRSLFKIKRPMMFISGTEDKYADRGKLEMLMGALNPYAHLMLIPNTGHSLELLNQEKRSQEDLHKEISEILLWFMSDVIEKKMKK